MGKFRIYSATLGVDYTPSGSYTSEIVLNVTETTLETSEFNGKRDCILHAQFDKYGFNIRDLTALDYENVFKIILNQEVTFYPDSDIPSVYFQANIIKAKPYYLESTVIKDALLLELKPVSYE